MLPNEKEEATSPVGGDHSRLPDAAPRGEPGRLSQDGAEEREHLQYAY